MTHPINLFPVKPIGQSQIESSRALETWDNMYRTTGNMHIMIYRAEPSSTTTNWFGHNMPTALTSCTSMPQWDCVFNTSFQVMNSAVVARSKIELDVCAECKCLVFGGSCTSSVFFLSYGLASVCAWQPVFTQGFLKTNIVRRSIVCYFCELNPLISIDFADVC